MYLYFPSVAGIDSGVIVMWSGLLVDIPSGWSLCDGSDGRPDLRSKFIMGAPAGHDPKETGGSNTHGHNDHSALVHSGAAVGNHSALTHSGTAVADHSAKNTGAPSATTMTALGTELDIPTETHTHQVSAYTHSVTQPSQHTISVHSVTQPSNHAAQSHSNADNVPVYYTLAFIIKD